MPTKLNGGFLKKCSEPLELEKNLRDCENRSFRVIIWGIELSPVNWIQLGTHYEDEHVAHVFSVVLWRSRVCAS